MPLEDALEFRKLGFDTNYSIKLMSLNISPLEIKIAKENKLSVDELKSWKNVVVFFNHIDYNNLTIDHIIAFKKNEISISMVQSWVNADFQNPNNMLWYIKNGISIVKAKELEIIDLNPNNIEKWQNAGFPLNDVVKWKSEGFNIETALKWKKHKFTPKLVKIWNFTTAQEALKWKEKGFNPKKAEKWLNKYGYTINSAVKIKKYCNNEIKSISNLYHTNPYDVKGKCFEFVGKKQEIITKNTGLYLLGSSNTVFINFGKISAPNIAFRGIIKGTGV